MLKERVTAAIDWIDYARRGPSDADRPRMLRIVYRTWLIAFALKILGSTWDVSWHFKWLRDDLAPPHLLNTIGTVMVVVLVACHTYTGFGVDKISLRLMQLGTGIFLLAIPVDIINHAVNGLDITAWSFSHAGLYVGTAIMLVGAVRAYWLFGPRDRMAEWRFTMAALWFGFFENTLFPNQHQEYGVLSIAAYLRGAPYAEEELRAFAAKQLGMPLGKESFIAFALPIPAWVYLAWAIGVGLIALVIARKMVGLKYTATAVAAAYVAYRCVAWGLLSAADFPPSAVPFMLLGGAVAIDLAMLRPLPWWAEAFGGAVLSAVLTGVVFWAQSELLAGPPVDFGAWYGGASIWYGAAGLAFLWGLVNAVSRSAAWNRHMEPSTFRPPRFPLMRNPVAAGSGVAS